MNFRLPPPWGLLLDRDDPLAFRFEGRLVRGLAGDTIASALAASGDWLLSRSPRLRRARGPMTFAGHEAASRVRLNGLPDVPADLCPAADGMRIDAQLPGGRLRGARGTWRRRFERWLTADLVRYALHRGRPGWPFWEARLRRRVAAGRLDGIASAWQPELVDTETEIAVVGAGPAGLAAALAAARCGFTVRLFEQLPQAGGSLNWGRFGVDPDTGFELRDALRHQVEATPRLEIQPGARVIDLPAPDMLLVQHAGGVERVHARATVLTTGGIAQPAVFRSNDYPGTATADGLQRLMRLWGVRPGKRAAVVTANDAGYGAALDLDEAGVAVLAVIDLRRDPPDGPCLLEAERRGLPLRPGMAVVEGGGNRELTRLAGIRLGRVTDAGGWEESSQIVPCDVLGMAVGEAPFLQLAAPHLSAQPDDGTREGSVSPVAGLPPGLFAAGGLNDCDDLEKTLRDGDRAGQAAARHCGADPVPPAEAFPVLPDVSAAPHEFPIYPHPRGREFIDFDTDLTLPDVNAARARGVEDEAALAQYFDLDQGAGGGRLSRSNLARYLAATGVGSPRPDFRATALRGAGATLGALAAGARRTGKKA